MGAANRKPDAMEALREDRDRFVALAFSAADLLVEADSKYVIRFGAGAGQAILGRGAEQLVGQDIWSLFDEADTQSVRKILARIGGDGRLDPIVVMLRHENGPSVAALMSGYRVPALHDNLYLSFSLLRASNAGRLALQAPRDDESGLITEESFTELAGEYLQNNQELNQDSCVTFVEIGNLEELDGQLGKEERANIVREIGAELRSQSIDGLSAGRLSGDRFGIIHVPDVDADTLIQGVKESVTKATGGKVVLDLAAATLDLKSQGLEDQDALRALSYAIGSVAKGEQAVLSLDSLENSYGTMLNHAAERIGAFRSIVKKGEFHVAYQPIVDLKTGAIHHYEALARFGASKSNESPFELIAFAEEVGLVADFDLAMVERVVERVEADMERGEAAEIAVNLSGRSVSDPDFVDALLGLLKRHERGRAKLLFELTESSEIKDLASINQTLQRLRKDGHRVCLDDFGAGAAAFHYLRVLEVDLVKIDGIYVRDALSDAQSRSFLKAMVVLCTDLGIDTVAEMIEDAETAAFLLASGVRFGQGYLFGRPEIDIDLVAPAGGDTKTATNGAVDKSKSDSKKSADNKIATAGGRAKYPRVGRRKGAQTSWG